MQRATSTEAGTRWKLTLLITCLVLPSLAIVQKYLGLAGCAIYVLVVVGIVLAGYQLLFDGLLTRIPENLARLMALAFFIVLFAGFILVYPLADSGVLGAGSDRDEALDIAVRSLFDGEYPYYARTYLDNPISPMPGSLLLAAPFVLIGTSAYQSLFWLPVLFVVVSRFLGDTRPTLLLFCLMFALSPVLLQEFITGGDLLANSIFVLVFLMWTVIRASRVDLSLSWKLLPAVLLGIGLSSRTNMVFLLPLVFFAVAYAAGWKSSAKVTAVAGATFVLLTAPFYLYDPEGFTPLQTTNRFDQFDSMLPMTGLIAPALIGIVSLVISARRDNGEPVAFLRNCAVILALPIVSAVVLYSIYNARVDFTLLGYGIPFLVFGVMGAWLGLYGDFTVPRRPRSALRTTWKDLRFRATSGIRRRR